MRGEGRAGEERGEGRHKHSKFTSIHTTLILVNVHCKEYVLTNGGSVIAGEFDSGSVHLFWRYHQLGGRVQNMLMNIFMY